MDNSKSAQAEFVKRFEGLIWRAVRSRLPQATPQDHEEVVANTFISLLADNAAVLSRYNSTLGRSFSTYIHHQAVLQCVNRYRMIDAKKRRSEVVADLQQPEFGALLRDSRPHPEREVQSQQVMKQLLEAFRSRLSPTLLLTFEFLYVRDMTAKEAAGALGCAIETIYTRKKRIIDALEALLDDEAVNPLC